MADLIKPEQKEERFSFFSRNKGCKKNATAFFNSYSSLEVSGNLLTPHLAQTGISNVGVPMVVHRISFARGSGVAVLSGTALN